MQYKFELKRLNRGAYLSGVPENPVICHITHIRNLPFILNEGGLWCDKKSEALGACQQGIAHNHIKVRRAKRKVSIARKGFLCDYVPFYFGHHSPMLFAIHMGSVEGYEGGQSDVVYLVGHMNCVQNAGLPYFFTDGHAEIAFTRYYDAPVHLEKLDWKIIKSNQ